MKHLTRRRLLWASATVGLLLLGKVVFYDEYIRCHHEGLSSPQDNSSGMVSRGTPIPLPSILESTSPLPRDEHSALRNDYSAQLALAASLFDPTIRSCLGPKCFDMPAKEVDRVGLLAPQSSGAEVIYRVLKKVHPTLVSEKFEMLLDSHVPAYGYGKNHGWSRIIRIVRSPISQSLQLLHESHKLNSPQAFSLLDSQVRQLVRWHCRLSHVAAHTRMLTVYVDELLKRPLFTLEQVITYSGLTLPDRSAIQSLAEEMRRELQKELSFENVTNIYATFSQSSSSQRPRIDEFTALLTDAVNTLREEIVETKGLSMWPCRNFRSISPPAILPSRLLAPNCSSPWVTCSVEFDRQEAS